jgi:PAS domain S-box-containing protein
MAETAKAELTRRKMRSLGKKIENRVRDLAHHDNDLYRQLSIAKEWEAFLGHHDEWQIFRFIAVAYSDVARYEINERGYDPTDFARIFYELVKPEHKKKERWATCDFGSHPAVHRLRSVIDVLERRERDFPGVPFGLTRKSFTFDRSSTQRIETNLGPDHVQVALTVTLPPPRPKAYFRLSSLFQAILNALPLSIFFKDTAGKYQGGNDRWAQSLGYSGIAEVIGLEPRHVAGPIDGGVFSARDIELFNSPDEDQVYDYSVQTVGGLRPTRFYKGVFRDGEDKTIVGQVGAMVDITTDQAFREQVKNERDLLTIFAEAVGVVVHEDGVIQALNRTCSKMFGLSPDDQGPIGRDIREFLEAGAHVHVLIRNRRRKTGPYQVTALHADGTTFPIMIHDEPVHYLGRSMTRAIIIEIPEKA